MNTRIGFSTPKKFNPVSWIVKKTSGSEVSHCFFVYRDADWDADMVMEASEVGFRLDPLAHFEKSNDILATFVPRTSIEAGVKFVAMEYLATRYNFLGGILMLVGRWLRRKWAHPLTNSKAVFCSEAVVISLQKSNYAGSETLVARDTTPQDLLEFFVTTTAAAAPTP